MWLKFDKTRVETHIKYSKTSEIRLSKNKPKCIIFGRYLIWEVLPIAAKFKDRHQIVDSSENQASRAFINQKEHIHFLLFKTLA